MDNKANRHKEFFIARLIKEAKSKLSFRDYVALCELLNKLKDVERRNSSD